MRDGGEDLKKKHGEDRVMSLKCDVTETEQLRGKIHRQANYVTDISLNTCICCLIGNETLQI